jgi:hypothetical protein
MRILDSIGTEHSEEGETFVDRAEQFRIHSATLTKTVPVRHDICCLHISNILGPLSRNDQLICLEKKPQ